MRGQIHTYFTNEDETKYFSKGGSTGRSKRMESRKVTKKKGQGLISDGRDR